ncbi:MAG: sporulation protein [Chloroflexi bacterium]|nr:MAG: sporulation protein [Chloroflexota bacterium]TMB91592.1 MAG: sporulation protein [Chloroflexota bacterium]TMC31277.1 MAG: sporulation protein [Chloroflexota bacterium]TMC34837.1 MAG: sporulation protein [Chloroflexota bacterium]TMC58973.1 MAG: sporulation protein [Chloroflexota bacterium]
MNVLERLDAARDAVTVRRVYGDPYQEQGITIIPAASVMGGGGGGGDTEGNGGGGFGVRARPAGAWIIKNGDAQWRPAVDVTRIALMGQIVAIVALLTLRSIVKSLVKARG